MRQMELIVKSVKGLRGEITVPGDKSISHRALIFTAIAEDKSSISNFLPAKDCLSTLNCLRSLGVKIEEISQTELVVHGVGLFGFKEPENILDVGNSGTTLRVLTGLLAGQDFFSVITGDDSVRQRPMKRVTAPLQEMGAEIWARKKGTRAPIAIKGTHLHGIVHTSIIPSAQIKTAILLAGLLADGKTIVSEETKSRDHTERMLDFLGADITFADKQIVVYGGKKLSSGLIEIPGDISSAAFFLVGALVLPESELLIKGVGINPTRTGLLNVLNKMGAEIEIINKKVKNEESQADILLKPSKLFATKVEGELIPRIIDELPIFAVAATQAVGLTVVKDAGELRVKETDRITAICSELKKLGAEIRESEDGFEIKGPTKLKGTWVKSYGDHRIAMALAIAGLIAEGETIIEDFECVEISFPDFEKVLKSITCAG